MTAFLCDAVQELRIEERANQAYQDVGDLTCPVCLEVPEPADMAIIKGCEHMYCLNCILKWACSKENVTCPQCKAPFSYLYVHRQLDGTITDYPTEESLCLLKRAVWFTEHVRTTEFGPKIAADDCVDEYDYDMEDEDDYYSYTSGHARVGNSSRIVIGNRRWGENGSVRSGRMYARPVTAPPVAPAGKGKGGKGAGSSGVRAGDLAGAGPSISATQPSTPTPSKEQDRTDPVDVAGAATAATTTAAAVVAESPAPVQTPIPDDGASGGTDPTLSSQKQKHGRRAKRAARRAAADLEDDGDYYDRYDRYADCF